jgi:hypothetical protein
MVQRLGGQALSRFPGPDRHLVGTPMRALARLLYVNEPFGTLP